MKHAAWMLGVGMLWACGGACGGGGGGNGGGEPTLGPPAESTSPSSSASDPGPQAPSALHFVDATEASGLTAFRQINGSATKALINESFGAGVALVDVDGDGDLDAYLTNGGPELGAAGTVADALFLNDGHGHFTDGTREAGLGNTLWSYGVTTGDYDGDGDVDLYVTNRGPNCLYRNRGDGVFDQVAEAAGVAVETWSSGSTFFDFDRDGDLDLYVVNHIEFDAQSVHEQGLTMKYSDMDVYYGPVGLAPMADCLFENQGDGTFVDVSDASGIGSVALFGFQVVSFDYDEDGWPDLYVANDSNPNLLWRNTGEGTFEDLAARAGVALSATGDPQAGMGAAVGDYDGDLLTDLYVTNFSEDYFNLYRRTERGMFRDVTARARLYQATLPSLGWSCGFEDFDADGDLDLFSVNGHVFPQVDELGRAGTRYLQRNQLFENTGEGRFAEPAGGGGPGFALEAASRGAAVGDVDDDGDLDLLVGNLDGPPTLLLNEGEGLGSSLHVRLVGTAPNTGAVGSRLVGKLGSRSMLRLRGSQSGFLSSGTPLVHFGLGGAQQLDELRVTWPDGTVAHFENVAAGRVTVTQGAGLTRSGSEE